MKKIRISGKALPYGVLIEGETTWAFAKKDGEIKYGSKNSFRGFLQFFLLEAKIITILFLASIFATLAFFPVVLIGEKSQGLFFHLVIICMELLILLGYMFYLVRFFLQSRPFSNAKSKVLNAYKSDVDLDDTEAIKEFSSLDPHYISPTIFFILLMVAYKFFYIKGDVVGNGIRILPFVFLIMLPMIIMISILRDRIPWIGELCYLDDLIMKWWTGQKTSIFQLYNVSKAIKKVIELETKQTQSS